MTFEKLKEKWEKERNQRKENAELIKKNLCRMAKPIFRKYRIKRAMLFGSIIQNNWQEESDIDLYVERLSNGDFWAFSRELEEAINIPIDIYTDTDDIVLINKVIDRGEVIYEV